MTRKLTNILLVIAILLFVAMLVLVVGTTWFLWHEKANAESGARATTAAIREIALAAKEVREGATIWKKASLDQSSAITSVAQNATVAVRQLSRSASAIEKSSTALLSELTRDANEQNSQLLLNQEQARMNLRELQAATGDLQQALKDADAQISDPAIASTLQNVDAATKNAAEGLGEATKALTDVRQIADKARETYLRPVNLWWAAVQKLLGIGPPIVTAIK